MNIASIFCQNLEKNDKTSIVVGLAADVCVAWQQTGGEILIEARRWLIALENAGITAGDRVAISLGKSPLALPAHLAALAIGAILLPLNPALSAIEIAKVLQRAQTKLVIGNADLFNRAPELLTSSAETWWLSDNLAGILSTSSENAPLECGAIIERSATDIALLLFTSGTTGQPKGVGLSHGNLLFGLEALLKSTWQMNRSDYLLHALPPHHIHGLGLGLYGSLYIGNRIALLERFDAATALRAIAQNAITIFMGVPTMYHRMLEVNGEFDLSSMRLFISGSAPLTTETFRSFQERFGFTILERYGLTETLINSSNPLAGARKPGSVGRPLPGIEIGIFDARSCQPLAATDLGEIWVRGANLFSGYWQDEEATAAAFHQGWFRTGDLGRFDDDGYLTIAGRIKELIIVGGNNVTPGEVEAALIGETDLIECAAAGLPDDDLGERVAAYIIARKDADRVDLEKRLRARCEKLLAPYKRPRSYHFIEALPRNAMGKIERNKLKAN